MYFGVGYYHETPPCNIRYEQIFDKRIATHKKSLILLYC